jgi:signal transduction histidine kinase
VPNRTLKSVSGEQETTVEVPEIGTIFAHRAKDKVAPLRHSLSRAQTLSLPERVLLIVVIGAAVVFDSIGLISNTTDSPNETLISLALSLAFALYLWSPNVATSVLGLVVALAYATGHGIPALIAGALAAALVLRLGSTSLAIGYTGGFLIASSLLAYGIGGSIGDVRPNIAQSLLVATVAGGVGLALRTMFARGIYLEEEVKRLAERERQAVLAERRWIAGELHDSIAHHLTIVAMHAQLLDTAESLKASQSAIRLAARKALSELRFVIQIAEDEQNVSEPPSRNLAEAITEATVELEATGRTVVCSGDPHHDSITRGAEIILCRIVRESVTNIIKYADSGEVRISLDIEDEMICLDIQSPLPDVPRRELPSTGTGLNRMAERVLGLRGEFSARESDGCWLVSARIPSS